MIFTLFFRVAVRTLYILYFERYILFILQFLGDTFEIPYFGCLCAHGLCLFDQTYFMTLPIYVFAVCS